MSTSKENVLTYLFEELRNVGSLECIDAGVFESSQKHLENDYWKTTKTFDTVMGGNIGEKMQWSTMKLSRYMEEVEGKKGCRLR